MERTLKRAIFVSFFVQAVCLLPMITLAADADPEQDFCVADPSGKVVVNGLVCKNPKMVSVKDFMYSGLNKAGNTNTPTMNAVTLIDVSKLPALNTLGISVARLDFAKGGLNPPHTHPRATELLTMIEGSLYVGFVDTNKTLWATTINKGDVFVFPKALVHFQLNVGNGPAIALSGLNSQNPGLQQFAAALFESSPPINDLVLEKAFDISEWQVEQIRKDLKA